MVHKRAFVTLGHKSLPSAFSGVGHKGIVPSAPVAGSVAPETYGYVRTSSPWVSEPLKSNPKTQRQQLLAAGAFLHISVCCQGRLEHVPLSRSNPASPRRPGTRSATRVSPEPLGQVEVRGHSGPGVVVVLSLEPGGPSAGGIAGEETGRPGDPQVEFGGARDWAIIRCDGFCSWSLSLPVLLGYGGTVLEKPFCWTSMPLRSTLGRH